MGLVRGNRTPYLRENCGQWGARVGVPLAGRPHQLELLGAPDGRHLRPHGRGGNVRVGAITSALRCPALKAITGMPLACAHSLMSRRNLPPIGALLGGSGRSRRVRSARS